MLVGTSILDWLKPRVPIGLADPEIYPKEERVAGNGWYKEKWATPYMAAVAREVFGGPTVGIAPFFHPRLGLPKPDVTLTPQVAGEKTIEGVGRYVPLPLVRIGLPGPEFYPKPVGPGGEAPVVSPQTGLGAAPEFGEWFNKNRILVVVVIVALVLLFFFLKKGRR